MRCVRWNGTKNKMRSWLRRKKIVTERECSIRLGGLFQANSFFFSFLFFFFMGGLLLKKKAGRHSMAPRSSLIYL